MPCCARYRRQQLVPGKAVDGKMVTVVVVVVVVKIIIKMIHKQQVQKSHLENIALGCKLSPQPARNNDGAMAH
jgi:hypothetical protein